MTDTYSVHVEIGAYSWDLGGNDTPYDATPTYGLADPLILPERYPHSDLVPNVQPDPKEATITIIEPSGSAVANMTLGDPVAVEFYTAGSLSGGIKRSFYGRVSALAAQPHDLGIIYTVSAVDWIANLQETTVGLVDYPAERTINRVERILKEVSTPTGLYVSSPPVFAGDYPSVAARPASAISAYDLLIHTLDQWVINPGVSELGNAIAGGASRLVRPTLAVPISNRRQNPVTPYVLTWTQHGRRIDYNPPGRLALVGGLLTIQMLTANSDPGTLVWILDAGKVNRDATYTQEKGSGSLTGVTVTTDATYTTYDTGLIGTHEIPTTGVWATIDTELANAPTGVDPTGGFLIQVYITPNYRADAAIPWTPGSFTWEAWSQGTGWSIPALGDMVVITRLDPTRNPGNRTWIAGIITGTVLTIAGGRPTVTLEMTQSRHDPDQDRRHRGATLGVVSYDSPVWSVGGAGSGVTFSTMSTVDSWADYAYVRGS